MVGDSLPTLTLVGGGEGVAALSAPLAALVRPRSKRWNHHQQRHQRDDDDDEGKEGEKEGGGVEDDL